MRHLLFSFTAIAFALTTLHAQSPSPMLVVPAATSATGSTTKAAPIGATSKTTEGALKLLLEMKTANEETLRKQEATLLLLDELQKAAEQIKIYTKRG